jgi:hypothetical protein
LLFFCRPLVVQGSLVLRNSGTDKFKRLTIFLNNKSLPFFYLLGD